MEKPMNESHPSYATVQISRVSGDVSALFGSSIQHNHFIRLSIQHASIRRDLAHDWIFTEGNPIIEVMMSNTQLGEMLTNMNQRVGTAATISYLNGQTVPRPEYKNRIIQADRDIQAKIFEITKDAKEKRQKLKAILEKNAIGKSDRKEIAHLMDSFLQEMERNLPFYKKSFDEGMEKTVMEAKGEMEAFFTTKVRELGLKQLQMPVSLDGKRDETKQIEG